MHRASSLGRRRVTVTTVTPPPNATRFLAQVILNGSPFLIVLTALPAGLGACRLARAMALVRDPRLEPRGHAPCPSIWPRPQSSRDRRRQSALSRTPLRPIPDRAAALFPGNPSAPPGRPQQDQSWAR